MTNTINILIAAPQGQTLGSPLFQRRCGVTSASASAHKHLKSVLIKCELASILFTLAKRDSGIGTTRRLIGSLLKQRFLLKGACKRSAGGFEVWRSRASWLRYRYSPSPPNDHAHPIAESGGSASARANEWWTFKEHFRYQSSGRRRFSPCVRYATGPPLGVYSSKSLSGLLFYE